MILSTTIDSSCWIALFYSDMIISLCLPLDDGSFWRLSFFDQSPSALQMTKWILCAMQCIRLIRLRMFFKADVRFWAPSHVIVVILSKIFKLFKYLSSSNEMFFEVWRWGNGANTNTFEWKSIFSVNQWPVIQTYDREERSDQKSVVREMKSTLARSSISLSLWTRFSRFKLRLTVFRWSGLYPRGRDRR